jgi:hypothetical protein
MLSAEYPVITTGNPYTTIDTYNTAVINNGALNPLGSHYFWPPLNPASIVTKGIGAQAMIAYVQYKSTSNPNLIASPGIVYWVDNTFTTVTGVSSESAFGINGVAGYLLLNTTNYPGSLTGAALALLLNPSGGSAAGNFCWIQTGGYVIGARSAASVAAGDFLIGSTTTFNPARMVANTAPTNRVVGMAVTAVSSNLSDVLLSGFGPF